MATKKLPRFTGVFYRDSTERRHEGRQDRCFYVTYKHRGRKRTEKVGWASEGYTGAVAAQIRAERIRQSRHGTLVDSPDPTFGEIWEAYDKWLEGGGQKHPRKDRERYRKHLKDRFENTPLGDITPLDLEALKAALAAQELAPGTVKHILVLVRQMFNKARKWGMWAGENPVRHVKLPQPANAVERFLSPDEARQLLESLTVLSTLWHDIALTSLHTGLRAGEVFALRWGHVDLGSRLLHIADAKGGSPRKAPMNDVVAALLERKEPGAAPALVFPGQQGGQIIDVASVFRTAVRRCGFNDGIIDRRQKVTFHTLRHTFASWLALEGVPLRTIQELLGHKTIQMTLRYAHLTPDHRAEAVALVAKRFGR